jgi:hypothetical protein
VICIQCAYRQRSGLVWSGLVWYCVICIQCAYRQRSGLVLCDLYTVCIQTAVWSGLVWYCVICIQCAYRQRSGLVWYCVICIQCTYRQRSGLVWSGIVWSVYSVPTDSGLVWYCVICIQCTYRQRSGLVWSGLVLCDPKGSRQPRSCHVTWCVVHGAPDTTRITWRNPLLCNVLRMAAGAETCCGFSNCYELFLTKCISWCAYRLSQHARCGLHKIRKYVLTIFMHASNFPRSFPSHAPQILTTLLWTFLALLTRFQCSLNSACYEISSDNFVW